MTQLTHRGAAVSQDYWQELAKKQLAENERLRKTIKTICDNLSGQERVWAYAIAREVT